MASLKNIISDGGLTELISKVKTALKGKSDTTHTHTDYIKKSGDTMTGYLKTPSVITFLNEDDPDDTSSFSKLWHAGSYHYISVTSGDAGITFAMSLDGIEITVMSDEKSTPRPVIRGIADPTNDNDAATKYYVDDKASALTPKIYPVTIYSREWTWNIDASSGTATITLAACTADWNPIVYLNTESATSDTLNDMITTFNGIIACETADGSVTFTTTVEPTADINVYLYVSGAVIVGDT